MINEANTGFMLLREPGHADDAGPGVLLRRAGRARERPRHHDPELRLDGLDDRALVLVGFSLCFSGGAAASSAISTRRSCSSVYARRRSANHDSDAGLVAYQMMFAIITPALITGAFANRVTFKAYMLFLTAWLFFVYFPVRPHGLGRRLLQQWGRISPAASWCTPSAGLRGAGLGALRGQAPRRTKSAQHPLVALGTGLLWFGWYGFNAGSEFAWIR